MKGLGLSVSFKGFVGTSKALEVFLLGLPRGTANPFNPKP